MRAMRRIATRHPSISLSSGELADSARRFALGRPGRAVAMNLLKSLLSVSALTMASRILGFLRDAVIARAFGAGMAADAFFVAFKLPNLLRRVFAEGAFSQAFVPLLAQSKENMSHERTVDFARVVAGWLIAALAIVSALGSLAAPALIWATAPGFAREADKFDLSVSLLRVTFPYILLISVSSFVGAILNTYGKFSVPALAPALLNVAMIFAALFLAPLFDPPVMSLAAGCLLGGALQIAWQLPALRRLGFLRLPRFDRSDPRPRKVLALMAPALLGVSVAQISLVINTIFASLLETGSVSWLYYADRLMELPSGVLGAALGTILLPTLAKQAARKDSEAYSSVLDWGLKVAVALTVPAAAGLAALSEPIVQTLFMYGSFGRFDAAMTTLALVAYSFGLVGIILTKILAPGFYALQNIKTPVKIAIGSLVLTQCLNLALVFPFGHAGLALSISIAGCFNAGFLLRSLLKKKLYAPRPGWRKFCAKIVAATALMCVALALALAQNLYPLSFAEMRGLHRAAWLSALILLGCAVYFAALRAMGMRFSQFKKTSA